MNMENVGCMAPSPVEPLPGVSAYVSETLDDTAAMLSRVLDIIDILFSDTVKARYIDKELSNRYVPRGNRRKVRAQLAIYDYIKSLEQPE